MIQILRKFFLHRPTLFTVWEKRFSLYSVSGDPDIREEDILGRLFVFYFSSKEEVMEVRDIFREYGFYPKGIERGGGPERKERVWYTLETDYSQVYFPFSFPIHISLNFGEVRKELRKRGYYYFRRMEEVL